MSAGELAAWVAESRAAQSLSPVVECLDTLGKVAAILEGGGQ